MDLYGKIYLTLLLWFMFVWVIGKGFEGNKDTKIWEVYLTIWGFSGILCVIGAFILIWI